MRQGDLGLTSLGDCSIVNKNSATIKLFSMLDELNAHISLSICNLKLDPNSGVSLKLNNIQNTICYIIATISNNGNIILLNDFIKKYDDLIKVIKNDIKLTGFVKFNYENISSQINMARVKCRMVEIKICKYINDGSISKNFSNIIGVNLIMYFNRLSTLLFWLAVLQLHKYKMANNADYILL